MKKLSILLMMICIALLTSCHKEKEVEQTYERAIVLYFPYAEGLEEAFVNNIADIKKAIVTNQGTAGSRVLVILASSKNKAQMSELVYDNGTCEEKLLKTYTDWSFVDKDHIMQMLNDVTAYANAKTYSMVIGAHGSGWLPRQSYTGQKRAYGGQTAETMTNIETLDSAIVESSVKHLKYICFDDCYMANVEVAYALRNTTDYIIASTSEIMSYGIPYNDIWTYLNSGNPDYKSIVEKFHSFYTTYTYPYGALSVTDCSQMNYTAAAMKELNTLMAKHGIEATNFAPQQLDGYRYHIYFDMKDYTDKVMEALQAKGVDTSSLAVNNIYDNMIIAHSCTPYLWSESLAYPKIYATASNCGLTISDPSLNYQATSYIKSTAWYEATH